MRTLDELFPYILPSVPGCPAELVRQHIIRTARHFCHLTHAHMVVTDPAAVKAGVSEYEIDIPVDLEVVLLYKVWYGTKQLSIAPAADVGHPLAFVAPPIDGETLERGDPTSVVLTGARKVFIDPAPRTANPKMLTMQLAVKPALSARALDDVLFEQWLDALVQGTISSLAAMPGQTFSSTDVALGAAINYRLATSQAKSEHFLGRVHANLTVRPRPLA